jgi:hypothetical protein
VGPLIALAARAVAGTVARKAATGAVAGEVGAVAGAVERKAIGMAMQKTMGYAGQVAASRHRTPEAANTSSPSFRVSDARSASSGDNNYVTHGIGIIIRQLAALDLTLHGTNAILTNISDQLESGRQQDVAAERIKKNESSWMARAMGELGQVAKGAQTDASSAVKEGLMAGALVTAAMILNSMWKGLKENPKEALARRGPRSDYATGKIGDPNADATLAPEDRRTGTARPNAIGRFFGIKDPGPAPKPVDASPARTSQRDGASGPSQRDEAHRGPAVTPASMRAALGPGASGSTTTSSGGGLSAAGPQGMGRFPPEVAADAEFHAAVRRVASKYRLKLADLYQVMRFETGGTFSPTIRNKAGSGAVGLIQFMPKTAEWLGTSVAALLRMTRAEQMMWVDKYFGMQGLAKISNPTFTDLYMMILMPSAAGKGEGHVLFRRGTKAYKQNSGLDIDNNGTITVGEASIQAAAARGAGKVLSMPPAQPAARVDSSASSATQKRIAPGAIKAYFTEALKTKWRKISVDSFAKLKIGDRALSDRTFEIYWNQCIKWMMAWKQNDSIEDALRGFNAWWGQKPSGGYASMVQPMIDAWNAEHGVIVPAATAPAVPTSPAPGAGPDATPAPAPATPATPAAMEGVKGAGTMQDPYIVTDPTSIYSMPLDSYYVGVDGYTHINKNGKPGNPAVALVPRRPPVLQYNPGAGQGQMTDGFAFDPVDRAPALTPTAAKPAAPQTIVVGGGTQQSPVMPRSVSMLGPNDVPNPSASNIIREYQLYFTTARAA